jgi:hypothetical protein
MGGNALIGSNFLTGGRIKRWFLAGWASGLLVSHTCCRNRSKRDYQAMLP